jgi:hypothetical protein
MRPSRLSVYLIFSVTALATACSKVDETKSYRELDDQTAVSRGTFEAIDLLPADVYRLVAHVDGTQAEVIRTSTGEWQPGAGANPAAAALTAEAQDLFFPMVAYRRLDVDRADPQYGLTEPSAELTIETRTAQVLELAIGDLTVTRGGYYAALDGDPHVYIVIPQLYDYTVSIAQGERIERPPDPNFVEALDRLESAGVSEEVTNPWLKQVVAVEQD